MARVRLTGLERQLQRMRTALQSELQRQVPERLSRKFDLLLQSWPVDTGTSLAAMSLLVQSTSTGVRVEVSNAADYVLTIRPQELGGRSAWDVLIEQPLLQTVIDLRESIADDIARAMGA